MEEENRNLRTDVPTDKTEKYVEKRSFWHINRGMLPYKLHFFLYTGGKGAVLTFQSAFAVSVLGFTASNIALCFTAFQVSIFVIKPGIGYIADYLNKLKSMIIGLAVIRSVFYLFMMNIPNTNMPGKQFPMTSQNNRYCHLCVNLEIFHLLNSTDFLDKELFGQITSCFYNNSTENILIRCSSQYTSLAIDHFKIRQTTCNFSNADGLILENYAALEDTQISNYTINLLHIKTSQASLICLFPISRLFYPMNITSQNLEQYCYSLSKESLSNLQDLETKSAFSPTDCNNMHRRSLRQENIQNISTANLRTYQFWVFMICLIIGCGCFSAENTMSDTICYENVEGADYGQQSVWGAISAGLIAPFAGYLIEYTESYMTAWLLSAGMTVLQIWNLKRMNFVKPDFKLNVLKDMKKVFSSMEFLCFEVGVFMNGFFTGIVWFHFSWFIISIGGNELVIGLVHAIQGFCGNTPAMYFSGWLIKKLGHFNLVSLALICYAIRFFFYSYLHNPWWMLPIECIHGFTYGSFYAAMTSYAKLHAKPGTEATTQSILSITYDALGAGLGCLITGICLEYYGAHTTFFYMSILSVISATINILCTLIINYRKGFQDKTKSTASVELNFQDRAKSSTSIELN